MTNAASQTFTLNQATRDRFAEVAMWVFMKEYGTNRFDQEMANTCYAKADLMMQARYNAMNRA